VNLRLRRFAFGERKVRTIPGEGGGDPRLAVECEVISPPSAKGRKMYLFLDDADVTDLILELRSYAVAARR
jgi:hypothetical protein